MKQKDITMLLLAVIILLAAGYIGYTQLAPKKATGPKTVEVEQVGVISDHMDDTGIQWLNDSAHVRDFSSPVDFTGLGNTAPFGP